MVALTGAAAAAAAVRPAVKILLIAILMTSFLIGVNSAIYHIEEDEACNCDHCEMIEVQPVNGTANSSIVRKEDSDGDGNLEICARDRDSPDKSFPTFCHMLCYNRCTRFSQRVVNPESHKKHVVIAAYRTNYYKLHDGLCVKV